MLGSHDFRPPVADAMVPAARVSLLVVVVIVLVVGRRFIAATAQQCSQTLGYATKIFNKMRFP
jgi:hypothetical protein